MDGGRPHRKTSPIDVGRNIENNLNENAGLNVKFTLLLLARTLILGDIHSIDVKKSGGPISQTASQPTACEERQALKPNAGF